MSDQLGIDGECSKCHYKAITWHEDIHNARCRKCDGLIDIIKVFKYAEID